MLKNLWDSLFGVGTKNNTLTPKTTVAVERTDSKNETPINTLSIDDEIQVLAHHFGGLATGMVVEIELRELLNLCPRNRRKADSYYQLKKHLKDDYGVELIITSRTSKNKEGEV